jgi:hypothetical protein
MLCQICTNTFDLSYAIIDCSAATSLDDFCLEIISADARRSAQPNDVANRVVNVVIAKSFDRVDDDIQLHALEVPITPCSIHRLANNVTS